ncbi:RHS repeat-associated core domain-containing protein [Shewanella pneumatophori]|uniref:RHS repeat-associated core domain-containing protein n=1 Tax=Shewanella pneumatophori TaxID=314092 RepID=A0A9X1ZA09_9GAMM|nr:RHS repeat-associated core domain-containing protein [Shewanella pneumatophori]MCL1137738.1 RHS repeat-associated core domain-containing protein [Shewanella pneumatophori]
MQARYYDPVIGRFYSNDPVDVLGHMQRGNPVHGFGRYTYANNNPYKYVDPDGEFGIVGAFIGAAIDAGTQIATGVASGQSLSEAAGNLDYGSIAVSAALGAVGGHATQLLKGATTGTMKVGKTTVDLTTKTERAVAGADGALKAGAVGAIQSGRKGEDPVKGAGLKVVDSVTSPVPVGTIVDKGLDYVNSSAQDNQQQETQREDQN